MMPPVVMRPMRTEDIPEVVAIDRGRFRLVVVAHLRL